MKNMLILLLTTISLTVFGQPGIVTQAIITTKTTIVSPEGEEPGFQSNTGPGGEEVRIMRFGGDGETKTTTWLKNDFMKTFSESEMGRTTVIRDNSKKITTTIMEMMGRKSGFYATDEDQKEMNRRMDSMMKSRGQNNSFTNSSTPPVFKIEYIDESKKIAGYTCKKAMIFATRSNGKTDTTKVWYCPEFKINNVTSTGGSSGGFGGFTAAAGVSGMEILNGFPMQYTRNMNRGRMMTVEVTKLVIDKEIADKEFDIPKDIEIKAMKDMQNDGGPGRIQFRVGG